MNTGKQIGVNMNNKKKILIVLPIEQRHKKTLEKSIKNQEVIYCSQAEVTKEMAQQANVIIGNVNPIYLTDSKNLEWIQLNNAGTEGFITEGVLPKGVMLTNATGAYGTAISEHMIGMLLELQKNLHVYRDNQKSGKWIDEGRVGTIEGSTTLVVGLGDIGGTFASKMKALGSYTIGIRRSDLVKPDYMDELYLMDKLDELLPRADIVALSLPGYTETFNIMSKDRLMKMKKGSILLNVGRGTAIDTEALWEVLENQHLQGAGLDVTNPEPLPKDHKLWTTKNVIITPHVSGKYNSYFNLEKIVEISADNLSRFMAREPLINEVDMVTGYRKNEITNKFKNDVDKQKKV